jgi:DNA helicase HerA-like ATPase
MSGLIQIPDRPQSDPGMAEFYEYDRPTFAANQFLIIGDDPKVSERLYLGQVIAPQLNLNRDALGPYDNTTINQIEAYAAGRYARDTVLRELFYYRVKFLKEVSTGIPQSVRRRPQSGARGRAATDEEIVQFLQLPPADEMLQIGTLMDSVVPICVSAQQLRCMTLVAGAVNSGKSNTLANIIAAAQALGACVIVYDFKPDYQHMHLPNDEGLESHFRGLRDVGYWRIGEAGENAAERAIAVRSSDMDLRVLATSTFWQDNERLQEESFLDLLLRFREVQEEGPWSMKEMQDWLPDTAKECLSKCGVQVDASTYGAIVRKLRRPDRVQTWLDGQSATMVGKSLGLPSFSVEEVLKPGHVVVIRIASDAGPRGYGLFLSYFLGEVYKQKEQRRYKGPILHVIDEAQDIFSAGKRFQEAFGGVLDYHVRKGRSLNIGYVIGIHAADAVPEYILNNLNTRIIHRHNNFRQAREAMMRATPEQIALTDSFGSGECLAYFYGSNGVVHCQMRKSPFRLTKEEIV